MNLAQAIELADARKRAALELDDETGVHYSDTDLQDRLVFSGFDLDYGELAETANCMGVFFYRHSAGAPPAQRFTAAWCDGLLTGLLAAQEDHASHG